jgi:hypothetical protein
MAQTPFLDADSTEVDNGEALHREGLLAHCGRRDSGADTPGKRYHGDSGCTRIHRVILVGHGLAERVS